MVSYDEQMAASAVASLAGKRERDDDMEMKDCKMARMELPPPPPQKPAPKVVAPREKRPAPFFYYR
jgi:hypothetical protein